MTTIRSVRLYDQYHARANQHRPTDPAALAKEIRRLRATGLTPSDISDALRLTVDQVINALSSQEH